MKKILTIEILKDEENKQYKVNRSYNITDTDEYFGAARAIISSLKELLELPEAENLISKDFLFDPYMELPLLEEIVADLLEMSMMEIMRDTLGQELFNQIDGIALEDEEEDKGVMH